MEKNFFDLPGIYRFTADNSCKNCGNDIIPECINTEYCVASPMPRNNGILAMTFMDMQPLESVYPTEEALCNGTLFPNLNKPFYGGMKR